MYRTKAWLFQCNDIAEEKPSAAGSDQDGVLLCTHASLILSTKIFKKSTESVWGRGRVSHPGAMASHDWPWLAMARIGQQWPAIASHDSMWPDTAGHGWPWPAMTGHGSAWRVLAERACSSLNSLAFFAAHLLCLGRNFLLIGRCQRKRRSSRRPVGFPGPCGPIATMEESRAAATLPLQACCQS